MSAAAAGGSVALVGLRCSGKTSVGRALAEQLGLPFADLDRELARLFAEAGDRSRGDLPRAAEAGELLAALGEPRFRALEERALERVLSAAAPLVLATGGGAVESAANRALLRLRCRVVWLHAEPELLRRRMAADRAPRPALTPQGALGEIEALERRRAPLYAAVASLRIEVGERAVDELARELAQLLGAR